MSGQPEHDQEQLTPTDLIDGEDQDNDVTDAEPTKPGPNPYIHKDGELEPEQDA